MLMLYVGVCPTGDSRRALYVQLFVDSKSKHKCECRLFIMVMCPTGGSRRALYVQLELLE